MRQSHSNHSHKEKHHLNQALQFAAPDLAASQPAPAPIGIESLASNLCSESCGTISPWAEQPAPEGPNSACASLVAHPSLKKARPNFKQHSNISKVSHNSSILGKPLNQEKAPRTKSQPSQPSACSLTSLTKAETSKSCDATRLS